jgi:type II secretory pathway predicted ATPase ExeA
MGQIKQISQTTEDEVESYLDYLGWDANPFTNQTTTEDYVLPNEEDIADVVSHIGQYTGPILIHSGLSGVGKTTLIKILLDEMQDDYTTVYIGEHNVTPYELVSIVADRTNVGKSSSTKLTEDKLASAEFDKTVLIGIDEFGLNDPDTLHTIQFLNDEVDCKIVLTGMTSQWNAIEKLGSSGKAFQRRVSMQLQLEPLSFGQAKELIQRRITTVTDTPYDEYQSVSLDKFISESALEELYNRTEGVAGVLLSALSEALSLTAYQHYNDANSIVTDNIVSNLTIANPYADE